MGTHLNNIPKDIRSKLGLREPVSYKQFWAIISDYPPIFFRSKWEYYYALFLEKLKRQNKIIKWEHEPQYFVFPIKKGTKSYLPDFRVTHLNGTIEWVEVKGYMDKQSEIKLKRMAQHYPLVKLRVVDSVWFKDNLPDCKELELSINPKIFHPE